MEPKIVEELAREIGGLLSELKELKEELSVVKQERDVLYEQYDEMMKAKGEEIADLKKQIGTAGLPEGVVWPRFEDGEPVGFGDLYVNANGDRSEVQYIGFKPDGYKVNKGQKRNEWKAYGEPVKRPGPEVLDADGVPIKVGDTVYSNGGLFVNEFIVKGFSPAMCVIAKSPTFNGSMIAPGDKFTHRKPDTQEAIDADAEKETCLYFGHELPASCHGCPSGCGGVDVDYRECEKAKARDLLKRQRKLMGGEL